MIPPAIGTFGTMGRNIFRDLGYRNWDLSVFKSFKFKERLTAQFRAEFFNVLNHPNFANPFTSINGNGTGAEADPSSTTNFGCGCVTPDQAATNPVLGSGSARDIQLGLKLIFWCAGTKRREVVNGRVIREGLANRPDPVVSPKAECEALTGVQAPRNSRPSTCPLHKSSSLSVSFIRK
jgi:hypothetical protein